MGFLNDPDKASSASRQFYIETGEYLTYRETLADKLPMITVGPVARINQLAALLYDDVEVLHQYEKGDRVAIVWTRQNDYLKQYQALRLGSGLWPTYDIEAGLMWLIEEFFDDEP